MKLDVEPPSKFEGKKRSEQIKNKTIPNLIVLLKNDKVKTKLNDSKRNLEKEVKTEKQKSSLDFDYLNSEEDYKENITTTLQTFESTTTIDRELSKKNLIFNYSQKTNEVESIDKKSPTFYDISSSYSFIHKIKQEKDDNLAQQISQESKESFYSLYNFDEPTSEGQ